MPRSLTLTTDIRAAVRGWLIFNTRAARLPVVLHLVDEACGSYRTRGDAREALTEQSQQLAALVESLDEDQMIALVQQAADRVAGADLVARILSNWNRPRLDAVSWLRVRVDAETVVVPKWLQDRDWELTIGTQVMLAGDGFIDLHGEIVEDRPVDWVVRVLWDADRLEPRHRPGLPLTPDSPTWPELVRDLDQVTAEHDQAIRERDEARAWARGYASGRLTAGTAEPPAWLWDQPDEDVRG